MKNYLLVLVSFFTLSFATTLDAQDEVATTAVFNGFDGESYSFTTQAKGAEEAKTIVFNDVSAEILKQFDLKSDAFKGKYFSITYTVATETLVNSDGEEEDVEVFTIKTIREAVY
ncbi:hypothetical protein [Gelatiniphilus marinus]|uniref:Uncharacterized protein n=1 Tax=Gelatiniphilus marinus TaxID=1759464 RepID=A0ABW5JTV2_9FLAO